MKTIIQGVGWLGILLTTWLVLYMFGGWELFLEAAKYVGLVAAALVGGFGSFFIIEEAGSFARDIEGWRHNRSKTREKAREEALKVAPPDPFRVAAAREVDALLEEGGK